MVHEHPADELRTEIRELEARLAACSNDEMPGLVSELAELRDELRDAEPGIPSARVLAFASTRRVRRWLRLGLPE